MSGGEDGGVHFDDGNGFAADSIKRARIQDQCVAHLVLFGVMGVAVANECVAVGFAGCREAGLFMAVQESQASLAGEFQVGK